MCIFIKVIQYSSSKAQKYTCKFFNPLLFIKDVSTDPVLPYIYEYETNLTNIGIYADL
jgi:hypothetical protein